VIVELNYVKEVLHPDMEKLKKKYFDPHPDEPLIFHRKELLNAYEPFEKLSNLAIRKKFDEALLTLLKKWEYSVVTACIDKKNHKETYEVWRYDPYHYCLALLLERFLFFLENRNVKGDVLAESRGGKEDMRLKGSFEKLWEEGTSYVLPARFQAVLTSKQLKVKPKANNIAGLQLADLLAHPSRNEILSEEGLLEKSISPFSKKIIAMLQNKYYSCAGRVRGVGKKFI
jgi:hypothetical protein